MTLWGGRFTQKMDLKVMGIECIDHIRLPDGKTGYTSQHRLGILHWKK